MTTKVIRLPCRTKLDLQPDSILKEAIGKLDRVVILGWNKDEGYYFASSIADGAEVLWLLEKGKFDLMEVTHDA